MEKQDEDTFDQMQTESKGRLPDSEQACAELCQAQHKLWIHLGYAGEGLNKQGQLRPICFGHVNLEGEFYFH